jgi:hypothetical protein
MANIFELKGEYLSIAQMQSTEEKMLLAIPQVVGVAVSHKVKNDKNTGDPCLTVYVESKLDKSLISDSDLIPATIGKFKTDVIETGTLMAGSAISTTRRQRPVQGGMSVGHFAITAGTIATCVKDSTPASGTTTRYYILSNNHVLANVNAGVINDAILQPGAFDGGLNPADIVARLSRFVTIDFAATASNLVDCAIAEADFNILNREINWIGYVNGQTVASIGMQVQKTGRTTGHTTGSITAINGTVNVNYGAGRVGRFVNQLITTAMSQGGDSGSLVMDMNNRAVGLLYAGSPAITICNPIAPVMSSLGIRFI